MKNNVILFSTLFLLCLTTNLFAQIPQSVQDDESIRYIGSTLYSPFISNFDSYRWLDVMHNEDGTSYSIKVYTFDGVPYKGEVYLDSNQQPIEVSYWCKNDLYQNKESFEITKVSKILPLVEITNNVISFKDVKEISMFVVDAFTGDTVFTYDFPKPATEVLRLNRHKMTLAERIQIAEITGDDPLLIVVEREFPTERSSVNYSLPYDGRTYFVYFINTDDGKLRWVQEVVKK